jgi:catechol 2,3-dioxygenase-like lactoylglutathione lyase family enzyme
VKAKLSLVTLGVSNVARARRFYHEGLGLTPLMDLPEVVMFEMGGVVLALWGASELAADAGLPAAGEGFRRFALAHNVPGREAVDAMLAEAVAAGGTVKRAAKDAPWGGYSGYFADPDGFLWEVAWNPDLDLT